jgi:hypothetical protein
MRFPLQRQGNAAAGRLTQAGDAPRETTTEVTSNQRVGTSPRGRAARAEPQGADRPVADARRRSFREVAYSGNFCLIGVAVV